MSSTSTRYQSFIPNVTITRAVGTTKGPNDDTFDDLVRVGGWPVSQNIARIERIEVFATDTQVRGIRITYVANPAFPPVLHGQATGTLHVVPFDNDNMILVGVFGGRDSTGLVTSIGFVRFDTRNTANPPVKFFGPFGSTTPSNRTFGTYGNIVAVIGTDNNDTGLQSLGFVKSDDYPQGLV